MKLIGNYTSPYVRKISVLLLEKGIAFEFVNLSPWTEESHVKDYNPLGKVPALVTDAGDTWYNSPIIAAWLELQHPQPAFLPADNLSALAIRQLETLADGVCDAALLIVREQQKAPGQQCAEEMLRQRDKIKRGLDALEAAAVEGKGLNGTQITLADIATVCMLGYLNFRRVAPNWCVGHPQLVALATTLFQRDSFARTEPPVS